MAVYLMVVFGGSVSLDPANISLLDIVKLLPLLASTAVAGYCVIIVLVGLALKTLRRGNPVISYLSESSLPVYILHQVGIVVPGYYLLQLDLPVSVKLPLLLVVSTSLTLAVYHWVVRPNAVLRFVFGMPAKPAALRFAVRAGAATTLGIVSMVLLFAPSAGAGEATAAGLWWADNGSAQVEVHESDGALTGTIVWLRAPFGVDGQTLRDINHRDASRHDTPVVGLAMLSGFRRDSDDAEIWTGGSVYDPGNGRTYQGTIRMDGEDRLLLRGFIGISLLGRTTTWIRVGSEELPPQAPLAARVAN